MGDIYNVLIIGAGGIGAFNDFPNDERVVTHAHAFSMIKGFNLLGFIDVDESKAKKAAKVWGGRSFKNLKEAFNSFRVDVVSVPVPDEHHYYMLKQISRFPLKLIFAEKPITKFVCEAEEIISIYQKKNIPIAVNYSRRFVPEFEKIKSEISSGLYGEYLTGTGYYGKGVLHMGTHLVDFLNYLLGKTEDAKVIGGGYDFYGDDPSVSSILHLRDKKPFFLQVVDCNFHTMFELDFVFEKKRVRIVDFGMKIEMYDVLENKIFKGHRNTVKVDEIKTSSDKFMYYAAENIYQHLSIGIQLKSTDTNAYEALKICSELKNMFENAEDNNLLVSRLGKIKYDTISE